MFAKRTVGWLGVAVYMLQMLLVATADTRDYGSAEASTALLSTQHIEAACVQKCPEQNPSSTSEHIDCGLNCYLEQCKLGCSLWKTALLSTCNAVCNNSNQKESKELYCAMSCQNALNDYFNWLIDEVGTPSAPALVADSLTATSLSLEWEIPERLKAFARGQPIEPQSYLVQWRYEEMEGDWKFCRNQSLGANSTVRVDHLQPYTKYRFRVALMLSAQHDKQLFSEQSVIISTRAQGRPRSAPVIVSATAVDHARIYVSWRPGPFTNGEILSYTIRIMELITPPSAIDGGHMGNNHTASAGYSAVKDLNKSDQSYLYEKLKPNTTYQVAVHMTNERGQGPAALAELRTNPAPRTTDARPEIRLILGGDTTVELATNNDYLNTLLVYTSDRSIVGLAVHIAQQILFVSDDQRFIYSTSLNQTDSPRSVVRRPSENGSPLHLSVDWLNDFLYFTVHFQNMWQISRCDLNGGAESVVLAGLVQQPVHFEVDPYNGYLIWTMRGPSLNGIYRLDIADISNGVKHETKPTLLFDSGPVGVFAMDYVHYKLLVPVLNESRIVSMNLDGKEIEDKRNSHNTQGIHLERITAICSIDSMFYWTERSRLFLEEFHRVEKRYFNTNRDGMYPWRFVRAAIADSQPVPIPVNPPSKLQALLALDDGKISWQAPHLLSLQGRGSWQTWNYKLEYIENDASEPVVQIVPNRGTYYAIEHLKPNTTYRFRVAAVTSAGSGPWSSAFHAKTLRPGHDRYLLWSTGEGIQQTDILGEHIHEMVAATDLQNMAWLNEMVYYVNNYTLYNFNQTSRKTGMMEKFRNVRVQSVAVDWIAHRLYWLNRDGQGMFRGQLDGREQEVLFTLAARDVEIKLDSIGGYMYFSTGHTVEYCRLNGDSRKELYALNYGKQVMGLTLDMDHYMVYWLVNGFDETSLSLFSAPMVGHVNGPIEPKPKLLPGKSSKGPLSYFSDRLIWFADQNTTVITNILGMNMAHVRNPRLHNLRSLAVIDPSHHYVPTTPDGSPVNAIPDQVNVNSIRIVGSSSSFNISWTPVANVTHGKVFYAIRFLNFMQTDTVHASIRYVNDTLPPYSNINMSIQAYTYWAKSAVTRVNLTSPAARPFTPLHPRVFVNYHHNPFKSGPSITATFRWSKVSQHNGPNQGYRVACWQVVNGSRVTLPEASIPEHTLEHVVTNLQPNSTYFFHVRAFSAVGTSDPTQVVSADTKAENPVPRVLVTMPDRIVRVDLDLRTSSDVVNTGSPVKHLNHIENDKTLFWINDQNELMSFANNMKTKLTTIEAQVVHSLTVDWVNRQLFWSQSSTRSSGSSIYCYDLNKYEVDRRSAETLVADRPGYVWNLLVSPFDRSLLWVEMPTNSTPELGMIYRFSLTDNATMPFLNKSELVKRTLTLDTSNADEPFLIWANASGVLFRSSLHDSSRQQLGMWFSAPTGQIVKDSERMYWIRDGTIVAMNSSQTSPAYELLVPQSQELLAFYQQTYPSHACLFPVKLNGYTLSLVTSEQRSLTLRLPVPKRSPVCPFGPPGTRYTIRYGRIGSNENRARPKSCTGSACKSVVAFDEVKVIANLEPFQEYKFQVSVTNYYAEKVGEASVEFGPVVVFHTAIAAPSPPRNVKATVVSLEEVKVEWQPPTTFNSDRVWYEVMWQTQFASVATNKIYNRGNRPVVWTVIQTNRTDKTYTIIVRAYTSNTTFSESQPTQIHTLPDPSDLTVEDRKATSIQLYWRPYPNISTYHIYCEDLFTSAKYNVLNSSLVTDATTTAGSFVVDGLKPKTKYRFKVELFFVSYNKTSTWPPDDRFVFETLGDRPSAPGRPVIEIVSEALFKVSWEAAKSNGAPIIQYSLEVWDRQAALSPRVKRLAQSEAVIDPLNAAQLNYTKTVSNLVNSAEEQDFPDDVWTECYNGTHNYWNIEHMDALQSSFRVKALNDYGWGAFSAESGIIGHSSVPVDRKDYLLTAIFLPLAATLVLASCMCIIFNRRASSKKKLEAEMTRSVPIDVELANLRQFRNTENFIHNDNTMYAHGQPVLGNGELSMLAEIRREHIRLLEPLGSGQFGDVYKGMLKTAGAPGAEATETKVAVKTLKKGASEQDKSEFLQEAQLMSNCKHEHILHLIGVCLHADELFIVTELMDAGDLKMFLRRCRASDSKPAALNLLDLLSICVDIASGCRYLEEMHFIHRDLACRNCLVSSEDPTQRVVKIGDFGLARDIYSNDYYRKDGLGLMPVRWTSPECVEDGVFTAQSDIWAFGVLCWEIMTMGQQPYPARNNLEVLSYVKSGGRLSRPVDCPDELYLLMLKCWSERKEDRPSFRYCLDVVKTLADTTSKAIQLTAGSMNRLNCGIFNPSYLFADENHNHCKKGGSLKISIDGHDRTEPPIIVTPTSSTASPIPPKYLELMHDHTDHHDGHMLDHPARLIGSGYEIPIADYDNDADTQSVYSYDRTSLSSSIHTIPSASPTHPHGNHHNPMFDYPASCSESPAGDTERTSSDSSARSEPSHFDRRSDQPLSANTILKVALPNSKENCASNETLLQHTRLTAGLNAHTFSDNCTKSMARLPNFYTQAKQRDIDILSNGEAKTMM